MIQYFPHLQMPQVNAKWFSATLALVLLTVVPASAQLEGKWAGWFESPGSTAAIRLRIAGRNNSEMTMNVYGQQTVHPLGDLTVDGANISFVSEFFENKFRFKGSLDGKTLSGTFDLLSGERALIGKWSVRRFDDSKLDRVVGVAPRGKNQLPKPKGRFAIGRRTFVWTDESRPETITDDPNDRRTMLVHLWYPAGKNSGIGAPYIDNLEEMYSKASNLAILRTISTHARQDAALARSKTPFPVIVFAPGLGSRIWAYTSIIENLVSHGYAVVAINPGYDAGDFKMPDGRIIGYMANVWDQPVSTTWTAEKRKQFFDERRREWAGDMSFALDRLKKLNGDLGGKFDTDTTGALGHSFGGQAISIACADDNRFKACANLDGLAQGSAFLPNSKGENLKQPFAFFSKTPVNPEFELGLMGFKRSDYDARERHRMLELWKPSLKTRLAAIEQGTYFVVVRGANHRSFSDSPLLEATPKDETLADRLARAEIINEYILAFFDNFLRGRPSRLFKERDSSRPSVVVEFLKK